MNRGERHERQYHSAARRAVVKSIRMLHPSAAFLYFISLIALTMATLHPVTGGILFAAGALLYARLKGRRAFLRSFGWVLALMLCITAINPLFVHRGATVLFFINDSPFTLEALVYGAVSSFMLGGAFFWFACLSDVMTDDKIVCLLGRRCPRIALLLSMTLAFVPRLKRCAAETEDALTALGVYDGDGIIRRARAKMSVFSVLVSQSLEGSIETADSMLARGYGLPGRSPYSRYRFTVTDGVICALTVCATTAIILLRVCGAGDFGFYPEITHLAFDTKSILLFAFTFVRSIPCAVTG